MRIDVNACCYVVYPGFGVVLCCAGQDRTIGLLSSFFFFFFLARVEDRMGSGEWRPRQLFVTHLLPIYGTSSGVPAFKRTYPVDATLDYYHAWHLHLSSRSCSTSEGDIGAEND
jgi:hypothetical protein